MMKSPKIPFGMLFAESVCERTLPLMEADYDPSTCISYTIDGSGKKIPYVEAEWAMSSTQTITEVSKEVTDTDRPTGTHTFTHVRVEPTDSD